MKPLGTITKYYPFLDSDTRETLDMIMEESTNYYDFVLKLGKHVLEEKTSDSLAYLAAVHAWWVRDIELAKSLGQKCEHLPQVRPWTFLVYTAESSQALQYDAFKAALDAALETSIDDWIITELHVLHSLFHWPYLFDAPSQLRPLEEAKQLISKNPKLQCFSPLVIFLESEARSKAGDCEGDITGYDAAYRQAVEFGDSVVEYMFRLVRANYERNKNLSESFRLFDELYRFAQELGVASFQVEVLHDLSMSFEVAGEYDLAISSQLECIEMVGLSDPGIDTYYSALSRQYASMGNGAKALEFADKVFESIGEVDYPTPYLRKARALVLLCQLDQAENYLAAGHSRMLKIGQEFRYMEYYLIYGDLESARGDLPSAQNYFEQALEIAERLGFLLRWNLILLALARLELAQAGESIDTSERFMPGKWLSRLENHVKSQDMPGIAIQTALIKSEFYQAYGQLKDARETLQQALKISDSLGVRTLRAKVTNRIGELNRLIAEAEIRPGRR
ncbi:MAG: tetratricopeptide repeat protein [Candidatus Thorarchaeota archaeon]|jgi:tetratricopeptide (TPR) repeat protein